MLPLLWDNHNNMLRATVLTVSLMMMVHAIPLDPVFYDVPVANCEILSIDVMPRRTLKAFSSVLGPITPVRLEGGVVIASYPQLMTSPPTYQIEAVRGNGLLQCSFCPYDNPPDGTAPTPLSAGGIAPERAPMYGPCLNRARSTKVACVQNTLLYPPTFVGEYFFPDQAPRGGAIPNPDYFAEHRYFVKDRLVWGLLPSNFGIGRGKVQSQLATFSIKSSDGTVNQTLTNQFFQDYLSPSTNDEGWLMWSQHYCSFGCHRDSEVQTVAVRDQDWRNQSAILQFLNRKNADGTPIPNMTRCNLCPVHHASYVWIDVAAAPVKPLIWNTMSRTCFPWFGAIPTLISANGFVLQTAPTAHSLATDGVLTPTSSNYVASTVCPVNTYNDVCAHAIQYYAQAARDLSFSADDRSLYLSKSGCKPCPLGGYHTDGQTGAWFCLPPAGNLLFNRKLLLQYVRQTTQNNESTAWARRDVLGYEFECGYLAEHCVQCASFNKPAGMLPDEFNQQMILAPLLQAVPCASGYYCPHPLHEAAKPCPAAKPWSPPGSSMLSNCTCAKGTYLNAQGLCEPCLAWNSCPSGTFRAGLTYCNTIDGAVSSGVCQDCTNKPAQAVYAGPGIESLYTNSSGASVQAGACPFVCAEGLALTGARKDGVQSNSICLYQWQCAPLRPFKVLGELKYLPALSALRDGFTADADRGCLYATLLSDGLSNSIKSANYLPVSASCLSVACPSTHPCYVSKDATYAANVECASCASPPALTYYPKTAQDQSTLLADRALMCQYRCNDNNYYVNKTVGVFACQSCTALADRICPPQWQVQGGGCLQNDTAFTSSLDTSWCTNCAKSAPDASTNKFLNLATCLAEDCPPFVLGSTYRLTPCAGTIHHGPYPVSTECTTTGACNRLTQYLSGQCMELTNPVCTDCTELQPGSHKVANCTHVFDDSIWVECPAGFYCDGLGGTTACPYPKISLPGKSSVLSCFCPAGMQLVGDACVFMRCDDATADLSSPGGNLRSGSYMALDSTTTKCYPCPANSSGAFTLGAHSVGLGACQCPIDTYFHPQLRQCIACLSGCPGCWRGDATCISSSTCVLPPFALPDSSCAAPRCQLGFVLGPTTALRRAVTGSASYVTETNFRHGWTVQYNTAASYEIIRVAVTSCSRGSDGGPNSQQIALFSLNARPFVVYALPFLGPVGKDPTSDYKFWCSLLPSDEPNFQLAQMATSKWPQLDSLAPLTTGFNAAFSSWVGQVLYSLADHSLRLFTNQVSLSSSGRPEWATAEGCGAFKQNPVLISSGFAPEQSDVPALQHQFAYPGGTDSSAFYVAFNNWVLGTCGVIAYNTDTEAHIALDLSSATQNNKRRITAMAVLTSLNNPVLYLAFDNAPGSVQLIQWISSAYSTAAIDELFFDASLVPRSLTQAWASDQLLWARMARYVRTADTSAAAPLIGTMGIYTADKDYQRTFTEVQDMPFSSHPDMGPLVMTTGAQTALVVAAHGSTLFTLPVSRCMSTLVNDQYQPRYWDPESRSCVPHTCVMSRSCAGDNDRKFFNQSLKSCVCKPGYYIDAGANPSSPCKDCAAGFYCNNNQARACPSGLTSDANARTELDCACASGQFFSGGQCRECAVGSWCPNRWDSVACPGAVDVARTSVLSSVYPAPCMCAAGYTGPSCTLCPTGYWCAASATMTTNYALGLTISFISSSPSSSPCSVVQAKVLSFFETVDPSALVYCTFVPASARTRPLVVYMVQTNSGNQADNMLRIWTNFTSTAGGFVADLADPTLLHVPFSSVYKNVANLCPLPGKTSRPDGAACQCAPGYASAQTSSCVGCLPNYFKSSAGVGACVPCPSGMTSIAASATCASPTNGKQTDNNTTSTSTQSATNVPVIAGGVIGGVFLVGVMLFGFNQFYAVPAAV